ncbi:MAG: ATP-binding protein [Anaerolineae bacterium]
MAVRVPKRVSTALLNSLGAGVVPRLGLEHIAVGRREEVAALLRDLDNAAEGGAAFRLVVGRYGSGKSFMLQLLRNHAMERDFVVADVDLSPERRLVGSNGQGLATYRELLGNLSTRTRPDGGALEAILQRWITGIQTEVVRTGLRPQDDGFTDAVERRIVEVIAGMEGMVHGFDFAAVLSAYWRGHRLGDEELRSAALRWLRGEFSTKTEARHALGVRVIIDDDGWYDYLKLLARFVAAIGYRGLVLLVDEAVNLYRITQTVSREGNYEKLLTVFNDTMQGKADHLVVIMGGTPQFLEDPRRGLYSYEALRSRLADSRFARDGLRDTSGPVIRLQTLTHEEIFVLLNRLAEVHAVHYGYESRPTAAEVQDFMQEVANRLGAEELLTPREVVRDFVSILNIVQQNPGTSIGQLVHGPDFHPSKPAADANVAGGEEFAEFTL